MMRELIAIRSVACAAVVAFLSGCDRGEFAPAEPSRYFFVDHAEDAVRELPLRQRTQLSTSITMADETRRSLVPPTPSRLTFDVDVPVDAMLRFAIGVFTFDAPGLAAAVEFNLYVDAGSRDVQPERPVGASERHPDLHRLLALRSYRGLRLLSEYDAEHRCVC